MMIEYVVKKNEECYEYVFILYYFDEECEVVWFLCIVFVYDRQIVVGVQMGQVNGWECLNYYVFIGFDDYVVCSFCCGGWW